MRFSFLYLLILIVFTTGCSDNDGKDIVVEEREDLFINEIYPAAGEDWLELYNNSDATKDIGGYKIFDDPANKYALPAGTTIPAKGFLVLICDDTGSGLHTNFKLASAGETVYLENVKGSVIDKVVFPSLSDGQSYGRFPDGSDTFGTSGAATQGTSNGTAKAPLIMNVTRSITVPALTDNVVIKAEVTSASALENVSLHYRRDAGSFTVTTMSKNGSFWEGTIPAQNAAGEIQYYVSAENAEGATSLNPFNAPDETYAYLLNTDQLPALKVNEFMAANSSCCPDTDGGEEEFNDWIEIYNGGDVAVDIGGMYLSDDIANPFKKKIPDTDPALTTIQPGGYLLLWADEQSSQGVLHLNFQLNPAGEEVGLFYKDGRAIHTYAFGQQQDNVSFGLSPDGGTEWKAFLTPTPSGANAE